MRHRKSGRKFGMDPAARKAMYRNMVTSLMLHGQIRTTVERAKELRKYADRVISLGKNAPSTNAIASLAGDELKAAKAARVHAIRRARRWVNNDEAMDRVFGEYAERFSTRPGGYTRVIKAGWRAGDNAAMAVIQVVEALGEKAQPAETAPEVAEEVPAPAETVEAAADEVEAAPEEVEAASEEVEAASEEAPAEEAAADEAEEDVEDEDTEA